jgi:hypothetical protein
VSDGSCNALICQVWVSTGYMCMYQIYIRQRTVYNVQQYTTIHYLSENYQLPLLIHLKYYSKPMLQTVHIQSGAAAGSDKLQLSYKIMTCHHVNAASLCASIIPSDYFSCDNDCPWHIQYLSDTALTFLVTYHCQ